MSKKAIILLDHGSRRSEANTILQKLSRELQAALPDTLVLEAHLELAEPDLPAAIKKCIASGVQSVIIHPYFLAPGRHTRQDIPELIQSAKEEYPDIRFQMTAPLGPDPSFLQIILSRIADVEK